MAKEALLNIKEAEMKADEMVKTARLEARKLLKEAEAKAEGKYESIINEAFEEQNGIFEKAAHEGSEDAEPIILNGEREVENISNISSDKFGKAVNLVIERIVKNNGNS